MMKTLTFYLFIITISLFSCTSETVTSGNELPQKKKGDETQLIERYMKEMVANPTSQDDLDRNLIVNLLIDSLWDFKKTDSGIFYQIDVLGTGGYPGLTSNIVCHYRGTLLDGRVFDSSFSKKKPFKFQLREVVAAWQETIPLLQRGGKGTFIVPSDLAYGQLGLPGSIIEPNAVLMFEISLLNFD